MVENTEKEIKDISKKILQSLEITPGVLHFANLSDNLKNKNDYIRCDIDNKNINISVGLIISKNVNLIMLSDEITNIVKFFLKNKYKNLSLGKLNIYVKGVK